MKACIGVMLLLLAGAPASMAQSDPKPASPEGTYEPLTAEGRLQWFAWNTFGPPSLAGGVISAGWGTLLNTPHEYGTYWAGFGKRYGMRLTGISIGNATEAGLGAIWGEDPRYVPAGEAPFKNRLGHVVKMTFLATGRDGRTMPAYARYVAIPGNNFLSNAWRADSDSTIARAGIRTLLGFAGRMAGNAFEEFWPDVRRRIFKRQSEATNRNAGEEATDSQR